MVRLPSNYGVPSTIYNRFVRWEEAGAWEKLFRELVQRGCWMDMQMNNSLVLTHAAQPRVGKEENKKWRSDSREAEAARKMEVADPFPNK